MPNVLAHNYVARKVLRETTPNMSLGSTMPDFVGMYKDISGQRVSYRRIDPALDLGIHIHKKTDRTYDDQPEVPKITTCLAAHLQEAGIHPRAARSASYFLADIMLDGVLYEDYEPRDAFEELSDFVLSKKTVLHNDEFPSEFISMVEEYFEKNAPFNYGNPEKLAQITQRRLGVRAINGWARMDHIIDDDTLPALAEVIDIQFDRVRNLGSLALNRSIILIADSLDSHIPAE